VFIDLEVEWVAKGGLAPGTIRIWDAVPATDCSGLPGAKAGQYTAIPIHVATSEVDSEIWGLLELRERPARGAYVVSMAACRTPALWLTSSRQRKAWLGRRLG
jgi:hypothetical protein